MDALLSELQLVEHRNSKLTLEHVLSIRKENVAGSSLQPSLPWSFLIKLIAFDETARNTMLGDAKEDICGFSTDDDRYESFDALSTIASRSVHPLDVLCALLHCSDSFLQQVIFSKMSMCQFAVPLLLPAGGGGPGTILLWPMRDIVKKWRPPSLQSTKGFREESLMNISMPVFSFMRLGNCSLSKSKIINKVLSPTSNHHEFFVHQAMESGYRPRTISEGLLEMSWFFPGGSENANIFHEPTAVMNLRGDLCSNKTQLSFLTRISSAVFIFAEKIQEKQCHLLACSGPDSSNYYFIVCPTNGNRDSKETKESLKVLSKFLNVRTNHILVKDQRKNEAEIVKEIQNVVKNVSKTFPKPMTLVEIGNVANELGIHLDESLEECQKAKRLALKITNKITDVARYKKETMTLQGEVWKKITSNEKELCRMRKQGDVHGEIYRSELKRKILELRQQQSQQELQGDMKTFLSALTDLCHMEKMYFLKWMKLFLDVIARSNSEELQTQYIKYSTNVVILKQIDQRISASSLGIEHFLREVGQMHESNVLTLNQTQPEGKFSNLPSIAADLLLDGFPLELIDGDASNIPMQWITDVLTELDTKMGGHCRMRVITVLGVQSTGKSTLLNTMFGLQFPVASGRCTRGAFMTLINVEETFQEELDCDFILVIDTEGLKAPELASLEDNYEHDNELATVVVGLSDITIINISMENSSEMKDILQIVIHAFLRMKTIGKKLNCQFVHQNVSDVSAHVMGIRDRSKLLEHLNEITKAAAKMEKLDGVVSFSDVMDYDLNEHTWYIPGLWQGVPPMAPINTGYSEEIISLKRYLLEYMKKKFEKPQNIPDFLEWVKSLWNAVKHEKFIFSFRNSLVADAYDQVSVKYSQLEWTFRKNIYNWMMETLTSIKNEHEEKLTVEAIAFSMSEILNKEGKQMQDLLNTYFESELENAHLVERYKDDFFKSIKSLKTELSEEWKGKSNQAIRVQKIKRQIQDLKDDFTVKIEEKVNSLLNSCKSRTQKLDDKELEAEFEAMWQGTIRGFQVNIIARQDIGQQMLQQLRKEMSHKSGSITQRLLGIKQISQFAEASFRVQEEHIDLQWYKKCQDQIWYKAAGVKDFYKQEYSFKTEQIAEHLMDRSSRYVDQQVKEEENYHDTFCQELLNMVNERIRQKDVKNLHTTDEYEFDLKLLLLGKAAPKFQKMHDHFVQIHDPYLCLEALKSQYCSIFKSVFQEKDECKNRAKLFCERCLKPAIVTYLKNHLGKEIVNDILGSEDSMKYMSRTFFQLHVLCKLLDDHSFDQYIQYINNYERFVKNCILELIKEKYERSSFLESLQSNILMSIIKKLRGILQNPQILENTNTSGFLKNFCDMLHKDLVISQDEVKVIIFQNCSPVTVFSANIESCLSETGDEIMSEMGALDIVSVLAQVTLKPEDELFKKVIGCGQQCPFCKVPCEAGCAEHTEHFATVHRPQGLGRYRYVDTNVLCSSLCSTDVVTEASFRNTATDWKFHPYKDYRTFYPDWMIQPDTSISASDYWKFIFKEFNYQFAREYKAKPAKLPEDWHKITREQARQSLRESFHMK
ncbi:up-regulator of cell proliferation-like [Pseudophryne corroboree]|uniref:up-regulator of cell proliferation-like n=1 Tax=Pseudophryne corroboree TaxID=495146 RepID=UPI0030816EAD